MNAYSWYSVGTVGVILGCFLAIAHLRYRKLGWKAVRQHYSSLAILALNTAVAFVALNLLLLVVFTCRDTWRHPTTKANDKLDFRRDSSQQLVDGEYSGYFYQDGTPVDNGLRSPYQLEWFDFTACESISPAFASAVLDDFTRLSRKGFSYQPWVQFSEPAFDGKYVRVLEDETGFLHRNGSSTPNEKKQPTVSIYVFGGSTTFGYNVADEHTWPSTLSEVLNKTAAHDKMGIHIEVVNYGRGFYNPSQEVVLLIDLLKSGHRPSMVIFMDGVNKGPEMDVPHLTRQFLNRYHEAQFQSTGVSILRSLEWLPVARLALGIRARLDARSQNVRVKQADPIPLETVKYASFVSNRFIQDWNLAKAVCDQYGVRVMFCVQPLFFRYNTNLYRNPIPNERLVRDREVDRLVYMDVARSVECHDFSGLYEQWGVNRKAVLDDCHYTPSFNLFLAQHVAKVIDIRNLKPSKRIESSSATGLSRHGLNK